jgi:hypothetical protein
LLPLLNLFHDAECITHEQLIERARVLPKEIGIYLKLGMIVAGHDCGHQQDPAEIL